MTRVEAIRTFFTRKDAISPEGGRKVEMSELKDLSPEERAELGQLSAIELGVAVS